MFLKEKNILYQKGISILLCRKKCKNIFALLGDGNEETINDSEKKNNEKRSFTMADLLAEKEIAPVKQNISQDTDMEIIRNELSIFF